MIVELNRRGYVHDHEIELARHIIDEAVDLFNALRDKIAVPEGDKKAYYAAIRKELLEKVDGLYDRLSAAVKKGIENA